MYITGAGVISVNDYHYGKIVVNVPEGYNSSLILPDYVQLNNDRGAFPFSPTSFLDEKKNGDYKLDFYNIGGTFKILADREFTGDFQGEFTVTVTFEEE